MDLANQDGIPTEMQSEAAQCISDIATVLAQADGTTPETAYARLSEDPPEANPTQGHEDASGLVAGQGALRAPTTEPAGQNAESATSAETGTDPSPTPIPDSTNPSPACISPPRFDSSELKTSIFDLSPT
jgi:hypothetical protein